MDFWVPCDRIPLLSNLIRNAGLVCYIDCYFDRHSEHVLRKIPQECFTTTRSALGVRGATGVEAHVFVARSRSSLSDAVASGWYPLVVEGQLVEPHLADHNFFGHALGYPPCCISFFHEHNDWANSNHYYVTYRSSRRRFSWCVNSLPRHTAYFLTPHIPCSFSCPVTESYAVQLLRLIEADAPRYALEIQRRLTRPMLCLSELRMYVFDGTLDNAQLYYNVVETLNPTTEHDTLYCSLREGNECRVEANVITIFRDGKQLNKYFARSDRHGPEHPFVFQCR